ncbi:winged helix-turn-helix transcriptional regulator [Natronolimnobius sp. AArcel1]|uniref:Lrp/AsnC family transcriptional regulator n=1 Tax=Natronolimnobius sp. AArcel1 TaxID=1679093 RepID=UPI0013ECF00B|nr:winged helix-turn-helix transcriptional regulator [Natronolimnobius sp. AArcel1]NGM69310.1 winged helix-turn-helix transcriptional regulator [Natronolimnobius sp. AArcel1]
MTVDLDRTDKAILHILQDDARNVTTEAIGKQVGLAASTVANRLSTLEDEGVIEGYTPVIDYETAGFEHHMLLVGTILEDDREQTIECIATVDNVISVTELMADTDNVHIELITQTQDRAEEAVAELNELGIEISNTGVVVAESGQSFNHFGEQYTK